MIAVVSEDLARLAIGARLFGQPLRTAIRREIKTVGLEGAEAVRGAIRGMPSKGGKAFGETQTLRGAIASSVRVAATVNSRAGAGVRVYVANSPALDQYRRYRPAALLDGGKKFRHKVYGRSANPNDWQDQADYPYFRKTMLARAPALRVGMEVALDEATRLTIPNVT